MGKGGRETGDWRREFFLSRPRSGNCLKAMATQREWRYKRVVDRNSR